jgi:hypothetical protein
LDRVNDVAIDYHLQRLWRSPKTKVRRTVGTVRLHVRQSNSAINKPATRRFPPPWSIEAFRQGIYALISLASSLANKRIYEKRRCAPISKKNKVPKRTLYSSMDFAPPPSTSLCPAEAAEDLVAA